MLELAIPEIELYDEKTNEFLNIREQVLKLEHSLISISKWESKWKKPFMQDDPPKTAEEFVDYIRCMTVNKVIDDNVYKCLTPEHLEQISEYMQDTMTATWFNEDVHQSRSLEVITSELIYYWMIEANIPIEFEKWHINRLMTLIRVFTIKKGPQKKMSKSEVMARNRALNAQRRAAMNSKG